MQRSIFADGSREFFAVLLAALLVAFVIWRGDFCALSDGPSVRWAFLIGGSAICVLAAFGLIALPHFEGEITGSQDFGTNLRAVLELIFLQGTDTFDPASARAEAVFSRNQRGGGSFRSAYGVSFSQTDPAQTN
ncbi:MAG: hypothetical protein WCA06_08475 [Terrimicrobiaceae bacterium]